MAGLNHSDVLQRLDEERRCVSTDGEFIEILPEVTRLWATDNSHHTVIYSSLTPENAEQIISDEIEHHRQLQVGFEWKLYSHDSPVDMLERLKRSGFSVGEREAVMVFDLSNRPKWIQETGEPRVVRVDSVAQIADFRRTAEAVFGKDYAFTSKQLADAIESGSAQHRGYIAYDQNEPVSVGRLYTHPESRFGGLFGGGTLPASRGRGFYRALVAARAREAMALGANYLMVDALTSSRPILERMGFEWVADTWPCVYER